MRPGELFRARAMLARPFSLAVNATENRKKDMRYNRVAAVFAAMAVVALAGCGTVVGQSSPAAAPPTQAANLVMVGGQPAPSAPYEATVLYDHGDGRGPVLHCGSTLIARIGNTSWFETNAHCVTDYRTPSAAVLPAGSLRIGLGSVDRSQQTVYPVATVVVHPWWDWGISTGPQGQIGDVALVEVPVRVPAQPIHLTASHVGQALTLLGWGLTTTDASGQPPDGLQQLHVTEIPAHQCKAADPAISPGELCTSNPQGNEGPCFGDSGSAALRAGWLAGSASRGVGDDSGRCGIAPTVYTDVTYYAGWLYATIAGTAYGTPPRVTMNAHVNLNWAYRMR